MEMLEITVTDDNPAISDETKKIIAQARKLDIKMKKDAIKMAEFKDALLKAMKNNGIKKFANDQIEAVYVPEHTTERFDSKKLKEEKPKVFAAYQKSSKVKDSIRVTFKE